MFVLRRQREGEIDFEMLWLAVLGLAAAAGAAWLHFGLPTPKCLFLALTGVPCLTCGGTRCAKSLLAGNFTDAFVWNPLVFLSAMAAALFALYAIAVITLRLPRIRPGPISSREMNALRVSVALVIAANWIYLIHHFSHLA
jgi:hypothetical protein